MLDNNILMIFGLGGAMLLGAGMWRLRLPERKTIRAMLLASYATAFLVLLFITNSSLSSAGDNVESSSVESVFNNGKPTFVMLYSHFCADCVAVIPAMNEYRDSLADAGYDLDVMMLDIGTERGAIARRQLGFDPPMEFVLLDGDGNPITRFERLPQLADLTDALDF